MWYCRLYYKTQFNIVNIPDKPSLLEGMSYYDCPALDIMQAEFLQSVTIKCDRDHVKNADYMRLEDGDEAYYYAVDGFAMTSVDVCKVDITLNPLLTMGGIDNVKFSDGITERYHVPLGADTFGAFDEDDPLIYPTQTLELVADNDIDIANTGLKHLVEATVDLASLANQPTADVYKQEGGDYHVTVPIVPPIGNKTTVKIGRSTDTATGNVDWIPPAASYYDYDNTTAQKGISRLKGLGIDGGILNSWTIPASTVNITAGNSGIISALEGGRGSQKFNSKFVYATVKNARVLYGQYNSYVIQAKASGNKYIAKPEDLATSGLTADAPTVSYFIDPRPSGRPYYYFDDVKTSVVFYDRAVPGMVWATAPLVYANKNNEMVGLTYTAGMTAIQANQALAQRGANIALANSIMGAVSGTASSGLSAYNASQAASAAGGAGGAGAAAGAGAAGAAGVALIAAQAIMSGVGIGLDYSQATKNLKNQYQLAALSEEQQYMVAKNIKAPDISYPATETLRDYIGNGCLLYRYTLSGFDRIRIDQLLTMYGYRVTAPITNIMLSSRNKFNYVKASGVTVIGDHPQWLRNLLSAQFAAGVRIWHVKPDDNIYYNGDNT